MSASAWFRSSTSERAASTRWAPRSRTNCASRSSSTEEIDPAGASEARGTTSVGLLAAFFMFFFDASIRESNREMTLFRRSMTMWRRSSPAVRKRKNTPKKHVFRREKEDQKNGDRLKISFYEFKILLKFSGEKTLYYAMLAFFLFFFFWAWFYFEKKIMWICDKSSIWIMLWKSESLIILWEIIRNLNESRMRQLTESHDSDYVFEYIVWFDFNSEETQKRNKNNNFIQLFWPGINNCFEQTLYSWVIGHR